LKENGGVLGAQKRNIAKAGLLYQEIERNKLFKSTIPNVADRSLMNVCFVMNEEFMAHEIPFLDFVTAKGMVGLKGHRSVGGFRASLYNALPIESVEALVKAMQDFEKSIK